MKAYWSIEKIKDGFDKFFKDNGRLPMSLEIDKLSYLPSSRYIQSKFGGLEKLRGQLGFNIKHFGKGEYRSSTALKIGLRGRTAELHLEKILRKKFGEVFVHTEKILDSSKRRIDFYVYSPDGNFGIDIFCTDSSHGLESTVNIKLKKYSNLPLKLYFVLVSEKLSQRNLDKYLESKIARLPSNVHLITFDKLLSIIEGMKIYSYQ